MRHTTRLAATGAAAAALLLTGSVAANGQTTGTAAPLPCTVNDISFYFGGFSAGLGQRSIDLTLLAHDGVTCTLKDTPLVTIGVPAGKKPIPLYVKGRGGTLVLRPDSPLHTEMIYLYPDEPGDALQATTLTLAMPDGTKRSTDFPGDGQVYKGGIGFNAWTTGIGLGEGEESF